VAAGMAAVGLAINSSATVVPWRFRNKVKQQIFINRMMIWGFPKIGGPLNPMVNDHYPY
jgi:hypothetical protein